MIFGSLSPDFVSLLGNALSLVALHFKGCPVSLRAEVDDFHRRTIELHVFVPSVFNILNAVEQYTRDWTQYTRDSVDDDHKIVLIYTVS